MTTKPTIEADIAVSNHIVTLSEWNTNVLANGRYLQEVVAGTNADKIPSGALAGGAAVPTGSLMAFGAATSDPSGWFLCDGRAVSRTTYAALFTAIATTFGIGDGSTTFNLPDLRSRVVMGPDTFGTAAGAAGRASGSVALGNASGEDLHALTLGELAAHGHSHNHGVTDPQHAHSPRIFNGSFTAGTASVMGSNNGTNATSAQVTTAELTNISINTDATSAGSGTSHNNRQLSQCLTWIIKQ